MLDQRDDVRNPTAAAINAEVPIENTDGQKQLAGCRRQR
jgi:hypothetical protein